MTQKDATLDTALCPVAATMGVIGGKWKCLILWHLTDKPVRFSALHRRIPGVTPKMLTQQLRELEIDGLVDRLVYAEVPPRVEYRLTYKGRSIRPILDAMYVWGEAFMKEQGKTPCCSMDRPNVENVAEALLGMRKGMPCSETGTCGCAGKLKHDAESCCCCSESDTDTPDE